MWSLRGRGVLVLVALVLGGGVVLTSSLGSAAAPASTGASSFVPITPCRLLDTRSGSDNVGPRASSLGAGETYAAAVWGSNGNCTIPAGATGVSLNVVAINPSAPSFLTVWPADVARPLAASLNWVAGQAPTPNGVTATLSADGRLGFYNLTGRVDVAVDVVGYYEPAAAGFSPAQVIWVAKSGGQFTSVKTALASITDSSVAKPYVIKIAPGTYTETSTIDLKTYVDLEGSGQDRTILDCACAKALNDEGTVVQASGNISAEIRQLTITNTGGGTLGNALVLSGVGSAMSVVDTSLTATADTFATALLISDSELPTIDTIRTYTAGTTNNSFGVNSSGSRVIIRNSRLYIAGPGNSVFGGPNTRLVTSTVNGATALMAGRCDLVLDIGGNPYTCT